MASNPDIHEDNMSESFFASNLPEWKRDLWLDISEAAQAKSVFHKDDYDENCELNMHLPKFTDLYRWLVRESLLSNSKSQEESILTSVERLDEVSKNSSRLSKQTGGMWTAPVGN